MVAEFLRPVGKIGGNDNLGDQGERLGNIGGSDGEARAFVNFDERKGQAGGDQSGEGGQSQGRSGGRQGIADLFRHDVGQLIPTDNYVANNVINHNDTFSVGGPLERRVFRDTYGPDAGAKRLSEKSGGWESQEEFMHVHNYRERVRLNTERWGGSGNMDQNLLAQGYYNKPTLQMPAIPIKA